MLFKFRCNIFIGVRIIKEMPGSVASGTLCIMLIKNLRIKILTGGFNYTYMVYLHPNICDISWILIRIQSLYIGIMVCKFHINNVYFSKHVPSPLHESDPRYNIVPYTILSTNHLHAVLNSPHQAPLRTD